MSDSEIETLRASAGRSAAMGNRHVSNLLNRFSIDDYRQMADEIKAAAGAGRLLDWGCGYGHMSYLLARRGFEVTGLTMPDENNLSESWNLLIREQGFDVTVAADDVLLPFEDEAFDVVLSCGVLEHVPDDRAILSELIRVLRGGGLLVVSVPDEYSERLLWRFSSRYRTHPGGHVRIYRRRDISALMEEHGAPPFATEFRHSLESIRWLIHSTIDREWGKPGLVTRAIRWLLDTPSHRNWRILAWSDALGNRLLPKSIVLYGRKLEQAPQ